MTNIETSHTHKGVEGLLPERWRRCFRRVWHGAAYVNICLAGGAYSLSYLKKQIISGSAPLPRGTCSPLTEIILSVGVGEDKREGEESRHHVTIPLK